MTVKCRKMHRSAYEWDGEVFPERDEYDVRERLAGGWRQWIFDDDIASIEREEAAELIEMELTAPIPPRPRPVQP